MIGMYYVLIVSLFTCTMAIRFLLHLDDPERPGWRTSYTCGTTTPNVIRKVTIINLHSDPPTQPCICLLYRAHDDDPWQANGTVKVHGFQNGGRWTVTRYKYSQWYEREGGALRVLLSNTNMIVYLNEEDEIWDYADFGDDGLIRMFGLFDMQCGADLSAVTKAPTLLTAAIATSAQTLSGTEASPPSTPSSSDRDSLTISSTRHIKMRSSTNKMEHSSDGEKTGQNRGLTIGLSVGLFAAGLVLGVGISMVVISVRSNRQANHISVSYNNYVSEDGYERTVNHTHAGEHCGNEKDYTELNPKGAADYIIIEKDAGSVYSNPIAETQ